MYSLGSLSELESVLYSEEDIFRWDESRRTGFQVEAIQSAFRYHYERCAVYQRFCRSEGVHPSSISSPEDIHRIPLIPSSMFKSMDIRTPPADEIIMVCRSSGTRGSVSRVPRDNITLERFLGSIRKSVELLIGIPVESRVFNLGPDATEAREVWFSYVMSLLHLLRPAENYVTEGVFSPARLLEHLRALPPGAVPVLVGPPIFLMYFMEFLESRGESIDLDARHGLVITAGGWKSNAKEEIGRDEFLSRCGEYLGLSNRENIRDAFNMVELNTVIFECERGAKHIPPWLVVRALDPASLALASPGEMGLLAFFDSTPTSYPGFVLSDDFGRVDDQQCPCGRSGPTLEFCRRVRLAEERGCALKMERDTIVSSETLA
jgi:long-chain-fatty-acid---luciferin-component ligase